jgi:hypothetical protein
VILYPREPCELDQHLQNLEILRDAETPIATHPHCFAAVQSFVTSTESDRGRQNVSMSMVGWDQRRPAQVRGGCVLTYMLTSSWLLLTKPQHLEHRGRTTVDWAVQCPWIIRLRAADLLEESESALWLCLLNTNEPLALEVAYVH